LSNTNPHKKQKKYELWCQGKVRLYKIPVVSHQWGNVYIWIVVGNIIFRRGWGPIYQFNPGQDMDFQRHMSWSVCVQFFEVRSCCSFCFIFVELLTIPVWLSFQTMLWDVQCDMPGNYKNLQKIILHANRIKHRTFYDS